MTGTALTPQRFYVARQTWDADGMCTVIVNRYASVTDAKTTQRTWYSNKVQGFPLVVVATDREAAIGKAERCYRGEITVKQARTA